jgi:hypothetical protein
MTEDKTVRRFQSCVAFRGANVGRKASGVSRLASAQLSSEEEPK